MCPGPDPGPTLREQREATVARLCQSFAQDELTLEELERRIDVAERSRDPAELTALLRDLAPRPLPAAPPATPAPAPAGAPPFPVEREAHGAVISLMGGVERRGAWRPARNTFVLALMGGVELDFRDVVLPPGETEINVLALMGGVDIVVPPGLAVTASGLAVMGAFAHSIPPARPQPDAPLLRINGFALMGGVEINVRLPGESTRDAQRRLRHGPRRPLE